MREPQKGLTVFQMILLLLTLVGIGVSGYLQFSTYQLEHPILIHSKKEGKEASPRAQETDEQMIEHISTILSVPHNETPTIATVEDLNQVRGQAFFAKAESGDKIIAYLVAQKAILYRPSTGQIVEVGPLQVKSTEVNE